MAILSIFTVAPLLKALLKEDSKCSLLVECDTLSGHVDGSVQ